PVPRIAIVLGRLVATAAQAVFVVAYFLLLGLICGAHVAGGIPGVLVVAGIGAIAGTGFGAIGMMIALRARSAATVQGIFPLAFVILFVSSAFFPRDLLSSTSKSVATYNPLSYVADGIRDPIISSVSARPVLEGLAAASGIAAVAILLSVAALRGRLRKG